MVSLHGGKRRKIEALSGLLLSRYIRDRERGALTPNVIKLSL